MPISALERRARWALTFAVLLGAPAARAQQAEPSLMRALQLEQDEKYREAAAAYREAIIAAPASVIAILGLERVYAQLGLTDSLLPVLDRALAVSPRDGALRAAQLRSLRTTGRGDRAALAVEEWARLAPQDPAPFREYARQLMQDGEVMRADSVLRAARARTGGGRGLELEQAQLRAAMGNWPEAAEAWRLALENAPYLEQAAVFSLVSTPASARDDVRRALLGTPAVPPRKVLATLEVSWGAPREGWAVLRGVRPDSSGIAAWLDFARRAEEGGAPLVARDALAAALRFRPRADIAIRAARAALDGGEAASAVELAARAELAQDSARSAENVLPLLLEAYGALARAEDAQRTLDAYTRFLTAEQANRARAVTAWAWVRVGDIARARALVGHRAPAAGAEVEGWLALYEGNLRVARSALRVRGQSSPELVTALALLSRTRADTAPAAGRAFLLLARGDSVAAADGFEAAARELEDARTLLMITAARLHAARRQDGRAVALWQEVVVSHPGAPEAPEANLEWARALRRAGQSAAAIERLEHLILTYPNSALVPQARRELELVRGTVPPAS